MTISRSPEYLAGLVRELCRMDSEPEWVEFKENNSDPQQIGEYISALSNAAALNARPHGYLLWGVDDATHEVVGTNFDPAGAKKGNEPLESWLLRLLNPKISFRFDNVEVEGKHVVVLEIARASNRPVAFSGAAYIRIGEVKTSLRQAPDRERELWRIFDRTPFEEHVAAERLGTEAVLGLLEYPIYFDLLGAPLPEDRSGIMEALTEDRLIRASAAGGWDITNLGAILLARRLSDFPTLARKAVRVVQYRGGSRVETIREQLGGKGYAGGFEGLVSFINHLLPSNEVVGRALRRSVPMFPELAVRELVANALIHQDFTITGAGPMVEVFEDRVEITNPGEPLVSTDRFLDTPPRSRNEALASLMRRFGICEERGSGIDKVVFEIEYYQLPAPLFEAPEGFTRTVIFAHKDLKDMDRQDRIRACYLHACLAWVTRQRMTNTTLRKRFGIADRNAAEASRLLKEALEAGVILIQDPSVGTRSRSYIPFWARGAAGSN